MPEEVVLLLENSTFFLQLYSDLALNFISIDAAVLVDDPKAHLPPTKAQLLEWKASQTESKLQQLDAQQAKEVDAVVLSKSMSEDAIRKRKEREAKRAATAAAKALSEDSVHTPPPPPPPTTSTETSGSVYNILIPATSSDMSWYSADSHSYSTLDEAREAGIWDYPSNLHERAKCGIFRSLWEQGYFMGRGITFGGDYLVYPGIS
jgi:tRNA-splicing endonuclease subunit Sen34